MAPETVIDGDPARVTGNRQAGTEAGPPQRLHLQSHTIKAEELDITHPMAANNPANSSLKEDALLEANANGLTIFHLQRLRKPAKATRKVKAEDVRAAEAEVVHKAKADRSPQTADGDETTAKMKRRRRVTSQGQDQVQSRGRTRQTKVGVKDLIQPRKMGNDGVRKATRKGLRRASCTCINQNGFTTTYPSTLPVLPNKNIQIPKTRCRRWNIIVVNPRLDMPPLRAA